MGGQVGQKWLEFADGVAHAGGDCFASAFSGVVGELAGAAVYVPDPAELIEQRLALRF